MYKLTEDRNPCIAMPSIHMQSCLLLQHTLVCDPHSSFHHWLHWLQHVVSSLHELIKKISKLLPTWDKEVIGLAIFKQVVWKSFLATVTLQTLYINNYMYTIWVILCCCLWPEIDVMNIITLCLYTVITPVIVGKGKGFIHCLWKWLLRNT